MDEDFLPTIPKDFIRNYFNKPKIKSKTKRIGNYHKCGRKRIDPTIKKANEKEYRAKYAKANAKSYSFRAMKRYAAKLKRTPKWLTSSNWTKIEVTYNEAAVKMKETGIKHEVDHIVPLQGELVSGLHVPWNLQVLAQAENRSKGNRF